MAYIYALSDTWNAAGTTFTGIGLNVTDSASAAGSLLLDLQVGGTSLFNVAKNGRLATNNITSAGAYYLTLPNAINTPGYWASATDGALGSNGAGFVLAANREFAWSGASNNPIAAVDLRLARDAADTLAQRRTTNAQTFRIYNTFTDVSNYERGKMEWASNVLRIGTEKAGTGTARALVLQTDGTTRMTISASANLVTVDEMRVTYLNVSQFGGLNSASNGVFQFRDATSSGLATVQFGGTTSSFPALKRSTTSLQARLADDSAFTNIQGKLTTETAYTAGAPTATGYIVLYDSNGTAYKVPAEAL